MQHIANVCFRHIWSIKISEETEIIEADVMLNIRKTHWRVSLDRASDG